MNDIAVIGAGVSGLTTALVLLEKFPKIQNITILAREIINDTAATDLQHEFTSWAAGANHMSFASKEDIRQQQFDLITYKRFMRLGREVKQSGIRIMKNKLFFLKTSPTPWYLETKACEEVSEISDSELEYRGLDPLLYKGFEYLTCTITPYIYLSYLRTELEKTGKVKIIKSFKSFESFKEIETFLGSKPDLIINCTGLGARKILSTYACEDEEVANKILPYKGQICVINKDLPYQVTVENLPSEKHVANYVKTIKGAYQFSHIFPRSDGYCIVGGVSLPNVYDNFKSEEVSKSIISNIKQFVPELEEDGVPIQVTFDYVALRPGRKGGVRLEYKQYGDCDVVHNYGIGGAGFQASLGLADEVARIIKTDFLQKTSKL
ncbi:nucleotide-binding domain-containing protein [Hanseniaspora valbyensis NRRL Y-1626]|uniref:Nucleotide-binding domain-containing protein n=1 Tax=Hanseniaspora valbyensis NRRL Y-1626 TaxID=766949 RepID=A0A1B7TK10_9ASCO|nr:nucleotide-binding domain-containing protein [Hanseniaspora valbyensis NRRL Y-1626]